ncbi:uncharacterized protein LOC120117869 [Hibiscus syriacus]|uniref:uncharacterized protein LOC120117869 n=1 Tax=Hibiscus syriacus TaxID=106335 RepID=UPI0019212408|nr:uncharacterized protein LOC120117869 [Hibiscus syriacus]
MDTHIRHMQWGAQQLLDLLNGSKIQLQTLTSHLKNLRKFCLGSYGCGTHATDLIASSVSRVVALGTLFALELQADESDARYASLMQNLWFRCSGKTVSIADLRKRHLCHVWSLHIPCILHPQLPNSTQSLKSSPRSNKRWNSFNWYRMSLLSPLAIAYM